MLTPRLGDTVVFKVYRIDKTGGKRTYRYLEEQQYIATDTGTYIDTTWQADQCDAMDFHHTRYVEFTGKYPFRVELWPQGATFDWLHVYFRGMDYIIDDWGYIPKNMDTVTIGNHLYNNVISFYGLKRGYGPNSYIDSTFAFYNNLGVLKMTINDSFAFVRASK
jgi:hypothetical protein